MSASRVCAKLSASVTVQSPQLHDAQVSAYDITSNHTPFLFFTFVNETLATNNSPWQRMPRAPPGIWHPARSTDPSASSCRRLPCQPLASLRRGVAGMEKIRTHTQNTDDDHGDDAILHQARMKCLSRWPPGTWHVLCGQFLQEVAMCDTALCT